MILFSSQKPLLQDFSPEVRLELEILSAEALLYMKLDRAGTTLLLAGSEEVRARLRRIIEPLYVDRIMEASDGLGAFQSALSGPVDVAIVEASLPRIDGVTLCQIFRAEPLLRDVSLILIGSEHSPSKADAVFDTHVPAELLRACVGRLLAHREHGLCGH